jgi:hypothetical protein
MGVAITAPLPGAMGDEMELTAIPDRPTQPGDVLTLPGAAEVDDYENRLQQAAEAVAERHMRTGSPEFTEWMDGRIEAPTLARLIVGVLGEHHQLQAARGLLDALRTEFVEAVVDNYLGDTWSRALYNEMRREL